MNRIILSLALLFSGAIFNLQAQGTAFLYQGHLNDSGGAANGSYNFVFSLYDAPTNGNLISVPQTNLAVTVSSGLFATNIDFGAVFTGTNYWLGIGVGTNSGTLAFSQLWPRQPLLPVPYAVFANTASNLSGTLAAAQISGPLSSTQLSGTYSGVVNFTNTGNSISGTFAGNGAALANLNGSQVTSGTVADARLSSNVALLNGNQTFTGNNLFTSANNLTNRANNFTGSFFGNGLVGWINVSGTSVQATPDAGYLLLNSSLTTVTLPTTNSLLTNDIVRISGAGAGGWQIAQNTNESVFGIFFSASNSTWVQANASSIGWVTVASSSDGLKMVAAAGGGGGTYVSTDSGQTWNSSSTTYSPLSVASSSDGTKLVGAINGGNIIISTNSGNSWALSGAPGSTAWNAVASSADGTRLVAVMNPGKIYTSVNSGGTWSSANNAPTSTTWFSVASSADGTKLAAVAYGGKIYTSINSGTNWTSQTGSVTANWTAITSSSDGTKLAAAAFGGRIYTSPDSGLTWTAQTNAPSANWYAITGSADGGRLAAVVNGGGIYVSANYGVSWIQQPISSQSWRGIACSADGSKMAAVYAATTTTGEIYDWQATSHATTTTPGVNGSITGSQGSAVELQYIGGGMFMPVSSSGAFWAN